MLYQSGTNSHGKLRNNSVCGSYIIKLVSNLHYKGEGKKGKVWGGGLGMSLGLALMV